MIEAMKQMTEALEDITRLLQGITGGTFSKLDAAIQAGRQAIREHAMYEVQRLGQEIEQEPVAWMFQHDETGRMTFVESQQLERGWEKENPRYKKIGPVYTHPPQRIEQNFCPRCGKRTNDIHTCTPPQRTWVGLTDDDEIPWDGVDAKSFARAIEAKLKDKNGFAKENT